MISTVDPLPLDAQPRRPARMTQAARRVARVPRSTLALLFISIILPLALFGLAAVENWSDVQRAAELRVERTTRILHEHALKVFETHQLMIDQLNERLGSMHWDNPTKVTELNKRLAHLQALMPQVTAIVITDANGKIRASSPTAPPGISLADRDWFVGLKAHDQDLPFISTATTGRLTGRPVFNIAARAEGPDPDVFDGTISVSIDQSYFSDFYRDTEREYDHLVVLAREDGGILASEPPTTIKSLPPNRLLHLADESQVKGFLVRPALLDGKTRILGYDRVGAYPVVIAFGIGWDAALAPWWRNIWGYGVVAVLSSLTLLGVSASPSGASGSKARRPCAGAARRRSSRPKWSSASVWKSIAPSAEDGSRRSSHRRHSA